MKYVHPFVIRIVNLYNKIYNFLYNNRFMNAIKELFYQLLGVPYPEYMYNDLVNDYVVSFTKGKAEEFYYVFGIKTPFRKTLVEVKTSPNMKYALDISKYNIVRKKYTFYIVNRTLKEFGGDGIYRTKRILTYT